MPRTLALLMLCALCVACSDAAAPVPEPDAAEWQVTGRGSDQGGEFCAAFDLSAMQVRSFFARARRITAEQLHDHDWLPCYVRGTTVSAKRTGSWEIRAGGTARIEWKDGVAEIFVCTECDDLLKD